MRRRDFLRTMGVAAISVALHGSKAFGQANKINNKSSRKTNFVFILADDLGWADTGCYGSKFYETPNIDKLATQGMKFTDGYAACAVCSPTRAAILTGRYPARIGVTDWINNRDFAGDRNDRQKKHSEDYVGDKNQKLLCPANHLWMDLDEVTIAEVLKQAGYKTCYVGKWHLGPDAWYPEKQGFDLNIGGCDLGQPASYFDPYGRGKKSRIATLAPRKKGEYLTDREADEAVKFIRENRNEPFFLYMAHYAVHKPIQAKAELIEKYKDKKATEQNNAGYAAMIESVDQAVGKIMATIDELNLAEDTVVIFTSDNGGLLEVTSNAPLRGGKGFAYEGGIREPIIVRWPGKIKAGTQCSEPVTSIDYFPTICEIAGVKVPSEKVIDGKSIVPLLRQSGKLEREAIYWHFPHYRQGEIAPYSIIRKGDWKLIRNYQGQEFELFNLKDDISEKNDLSGQWGDKVKELDGDLAAWLKETNAKLPIKNPEFDGSSSGKNAEKVTPEE